MPKSKPKSNWKEDCKKSKMGSSTPAGAIYCLGFIGAAVYYIGESETFWWGVVGFLKAIVWPALAVYQLLDFLN